MSVARRPMTLWITKWTALSLWAQKEKACTISSASAQKSLALQISSPLDWRSIQFEGKPAQFVSQVYTSDIDHTGALSEAIVTLPQPVPPRGAIELEIGYEGTIPLDATRLTRI